MIKHTKIDINILQAENINKTHYILPLFIFCNTILLKTSKELTILVDK